MQPTNGSKIIAHVFFGHFFGQITSYTHSVVWLQLYFYGWEILGAHDHRVSTAPSSGRFSEEESDVVAVSDGCGEI